MLKILLISVLSTLVLGCASTKLQEKLQGDGPTSIELYRGTAELTTSKKTDAGLDRVRSSVNEEIRYEDYTRDAGNEIEQLFPRLPNPRIVIYVFPHLSTSDNAPVPGYSTAVNLYEKDQYALPHEVATYRGVPDKDDWL